MKKILLLLLMIFGMLGCNEKKESKEITVYTAVENEFIEDYLIQFNKEYPEIKVNIISGGTGDILAKIIAEKENPQVDVIWSLSDLMILKKYNLLEKYKPVGFDEVPSKFKDKEGYWTGVSAWMLALGINTEELKKLNIELPSSYYDILSSKYENNLLMANPASSGTGYLTVKTFINLFGEENAWEYMDKLNKNIATYTASGNAPIKIISQGERVGGFIPAYQGILLEKKGEYPFITIFPQEGLGWELEANALIKKDNIKPESKIFLDWLLSENGMKVHSKTRGFVTISKYRKVKGYPNNLETYLKERKFEKELESRERILKEWEKRYGKEN